MRRGFRKSNGKITTHLLDTARGMPIEDIKVELFKVVASEQKKFLASSVTNGDGRCPGPLLVGENVVVGRYEIVFHLGKYMKSTHLQSNIPLFLDDIPIRFGVNNSNSHYHIPLLVSPYGYSTYRGS